MNLVMAEAPRAVPHAAAPRAACTPPDDDLEAPAAGVAAEGELAGGRVPRAVPGDDAQHGVSLVVGPQPEGREDGVRGVIEALPYYDACAIGQLQLELEAPRAPEHSRASGNATGGGDIVICRPNRAAFGVGQHQVGSVSES